MRTKAFLFYLFLCSAVFQTEASQLTNDVKITSFLTFSLTKDFGPAANQFNADELIDYALTATNTDHFFCRHLPDEKSFIIRLVSEKGEEVGKTSLGRRLEYHPGFLASHSYASNKYKPQIIIGSSVHQWFRAADLFAIKKPGVYEMEVSYRLLVPMTNGLPDYATMTNGYNFAGYPIFGIVTSAPVRVKIIKE